jgi:hypothetical protein
MTFITIKVLCLMKRTTSRQHDRYREGDRGCGWGNHVASNAVSANFSLDVHDCGVTTSTDLSLQFMG